MTDKRFIIIDAPYENGEPFLYNKILDKNTKKEYDNSIKGIHDICDLLNKLNDENEQLKQSIDIMGGRLQGLWAHYNTNRWGIWAEAAEDIANELGFRIYHPRDIPIPDSKSKKERVEGVKKITEILGEKELIKEENKQLKKELDEFKKFVFSDEGILCYSCAKCLLKGIYEVECSEKGTVDVHSTCCLYKKNEVKND